MIVIPTINEQMMTSHKSSASMQELENKQRILIIGATGATHLGSSLERAAKRRGHPVQFLNCQNAFSNGLIQKIIWRTSRLPQYLQNFSESVVTACSEFKPTILLTTGTAPITAAALSAIAAHGVLRVNWSTDDPWNPVHKANWFLGSLSQYDLILTPRRANLLEFANETSAKVEYLPFAYDDDIFPPVTWGADNTDERNGGDIVFVGGADMDREPILREIIDAGLRLNLYGGFWDRYASTRPYTRGVADPAVIRMATQNSKVSLCLVRRANRDGHVMRSYEIPASGGVPLVEDTSEHREIFGPEGNAAFYFSSNTELISKVRLLLNDTKLGNAIRKNAYQRITSAPNRYIDRLDCILKFANSIRQGIISSSHISILC